MATGQEKMATLTVHDCSASWRVGLFAILLAALISGGASARAGECDDPQTQLAMNECAGIDAMEADEKLNAVYKKLIAEMKENDPARIGALKVAQRAWIAYRDAHCDFAAGRYEGGSMMPQVRAVCEEQLTRERITSIETLFAE